MFWCVIIVRFILYPGYVKAFVGGWDTFWLSLFPWMTDVNIMKF